MGCATKVGVFAVVIGVAIFGLLPADVLKGISGSQKLSGTQLQLAIAGFCLSPIPAMLMKAERGRDTGGDFDFATDGDIGAPSALLHMWRLQRWSGSRGRGWMERRK